MHRRIADANLLLGAFCQGLARRIRGEQGVKATPKFGNNTWPVLQSKFIPSCLVWFDPVALHLSEWSQRLLRPLEGAASVRGRGHGSSYSGVGAGATLSGFPPKHRVCPDGTF